MLGYQIGENMGKLTFRKLRADEIDCRINTVSEKGVSLLLYKDARVDQNILDESVGPMNWQRRHSRENANCIVSLWDDTKEQWVDKEDTGTESNTEKEKGLASDSFKRACVNWGIGRELYTAPYIWINKGDCKIEETGEVVRGKKKYTCSDRFSVSDIGYDGFGNIDKLNIKHQRNHKVVYQMGVRQPEESESPVTPPLATVHVNALISECNRTGISRKSVCAQYKAESFEQMSMGDFKSAMEKFKNKPNKPSTAPPEGTDDGLPWSQGSEVNGS